MGGSLALVEFGMLTNTRTESNLFPLPPVAVPTTREVATAVNGSVSSRVSFEQDAADSSKNGAGRM